METLKFIVPIILLFSAPVLAGLAALEYGTSEGEAGVITIIAALVLQGGIWIVAATRS